MPATPVRPLLTRSALLERLPIRTFAQLPTPVDYLAGRLDSPGAGRLWVKRDDLTHPTYGGNKVRKLEFLLGDALARERDTVATMGGIGTNHGLATAIFARECGLACHLALFPQPVTDHVLRSLRLYHAFGAKLHYCGSFTRAAVLLAARETASRAGIGKERLAVFGPGGSSPRGTLGFVNAALELAAQVETGVVPEPETIFCALGSNGTLAGLSLGVRLAGLRSRVVGIRVTPLSGANRPLVAALANRTLTMLQEQGAARRIPRFTPADIHVDHDFYGGEYGLPTPAGEEAMHRAAAAGIVLEPTYTAKTFAAVLAHVRNEPEGPPVLYWNTFSSVDLSATAETVDWHDLPRRFHRFFQ
jgi:D-cysteine desulfhydrase